MNFWPTRAIQSFAKVMPRAKQYPSKNGSVWNLNLDQIESHEGRVLAKIFVSTDKLGPSTFAFEPRTVLYSKLRPYLNKVVVADEAGFGTTELVPLRCDTDEVHPEYLAYFLRSRDFLRFATEVVAGAKMPRMVMSEFWNFQVPIPPIAEQRRIANILDQANALRATRREALVQLDNLKNSIFIEMFGDPVTNPLSWACRSLGDVTNKVTDGEHLNPAFAESGMPIVMAGNVLVDQIDLDSAKRVDVSLGQQFRKKCGPEYGDLLIVGRGATIGRLCRVNTHDSFCLMGSVILVKPDRSMLDEYYLSGMLAMPSMQAMLYKTSGSSAQQAIYLKDVKKLACPMPPLPLQQTFATRIRAVEALKAIQRAELGELDNLFASLQHRAFRGKL